MSGFTLSLISQRTRLLTSLQLFCFAAIVGVADRGTAQVIALEVPSPLAGNQGFGGELGMDFDVTTFDIEVTSLGIFDSLQDGLTGAATSVHVELWERDNNGTPDTPGDDTGVSVLAFQTFTMGDDGTLMAGSRFKDISTLTLTPGSYSIVAGGFTADDPLWNFGIPGSTTEQLSTINGSGGNVRFVGRSRYGANFAPGSFPGVVDVDLVNRYHAGTFIYEQTVDFDVALKLEVDRDTGELTIVNRTGSNTTILSYAIRSANGSLDPMSWTSIAENYDADAPLPDGGSVDPDDSWVELTNPANRTDLSELEVGGIGPSNGATLGLGQSIDLGVDAWIRSPTEDITFTYLLSDGSIVEGLVEFLGTTQTQPYMVGDLDFNGTPYEVADFTSVMLPNLISDLASTLSPAEAYQMGDMNGDLRVDELDFRIFKEAYLAQGGSLALLTGTTVPEPATWIVTFILGALCMTCVRKSHGVLGKPVRAWLAVGCFVALGMLQQADAQIVALEVPTPLEGNQDFGGELGMDFVVNEFPIEVGSLGFFDSLQDGIMGAETSIHVEIWQRDDGGTPTDPADDTGIAVVASNTFTFGNDGTLSGGSRFQDITPVTLAPGSYTIAAGGFTADDQLWNYGIGFDDTQLSTINESGGIVQFVGASRFSAQFAPNNFPAFFDGGPENRYHAGTFSYSFDVEPLVLEVNLTSGNATILNEGDDTFDIDTYKILSDTGGSGSLDNSWSGLGGDWLKGGASDAYALSEFNLGSSLVIGPSGNHSLGGVFNTSTGAEDLSFVYTTGGLVVMEGTVRYVTGGVDADFNGDGTVNIADYTIWRNSLGATGITPYDLGDADGDGNVTSTDYDLWKSNFGTGAAAAVATAQVPEPSSVALIAIAFAGVLLAGFRSRTASLRLAPARAVVRSSLALLAAAVLSQVSLADVTNDRLYLFGDTSAEDAANAPGSVVGNGPSNVSPGKTLDDQGPSGAYDDLNQNGDPVYADVGPGGLNRPGAGVGDLGIRFLGGDDRLFTDQENTFALNRPDELAGPTSVGVDTPILPSYPFNYDGITARGLQAWVYPDQSALGTARQGVVFDTVAAGGVAITADGYWTQVNDGHFSDNSFPVIQQVDGDQWSHVMHHIHRTNDPGAPGVLPGTGSSDLGFTAVLYVNGIAVSANNDTPAPGDMFAGMRTGALVIGAEEVSGDGITAAFDNHFQGVIDDLEMYVYGDNSNLTGPPAGQDYGQFDLFADNKWIADAITSTVPGGELKTGDINRDGNVDSLDIDAFVDGWLSQKVLVGAHNSATVGDWETWGWGDMDHDGFVFMNDAYLLHEALLANGQGGLGMFGFPGGVQVPEPSSGAIALLSALAIARVATKRATSK
ncbi:dockerin type I domain-containing protein [Aeoliella sp.]|uniref:dockerin type I domain-containing protein n=1 Tax=Aeoliella sp. TaxID=2795800 RepID=UPI003CCBD4B7